MKKLDYYVIAFILAFIIAFTIILLATDIEAEEITFTWDNPEAVIDGVRIYQKTAKDGDEYDYSDPVLEVPAPATTATIDVPGEQNAVLKYMWVARAYRGSDESDDSNEVDYKVVNIPPLTPTALVTEYANDGVKLSWEQQADAHFISHWLIYYKRNDGEFIPLARVDQGNELEITTDTSAVAPVGEISKLTFVVVAYRRSGVYSANSIEASLTVDRRNVPPVNNFKIEIEIPL